MSKRAAGLWMATITALSWAVLAIALKFALHKFSSGTIVWARMVLAFVFLLLLFSVKKREWLRILRHPPWLGILAGVLIAVNFYGFMKGVELTTASNAQIMIQLAPMTFAILSILIFKEIPTVWQATGMLTALTGFGFFYWDQILVSAGDMTRFQAGNLWLLLAALTWSVFAILQKFLLRKHRGQSFNLLIYGLSAVFLLPLTDFSEFTQVNVGDVLLLGFLALNTVVAYGALSEALTRIPASHVSVIISLNPLLTLAIMAYLTQINVQWIKGEPVYWRGYVGAIFVVIGVIMTVSSRRPLSPKPVSPTI